VANVNGFREQVQHLGELISNFDRMPDSPQKTAAKEVLQLLMEVNGEGLERMMGIVFESGESGSALIDRLGKDDISGGLLLLYSLHPDALETRVHAAVENMRSRLRKLSCTIDLLNVDASVVQVRLTTSGHSCGSSAKDLRAIVENGIYELAPDVASLEILGLEEPSSSGFVALDSLLGHPLTTTTEERAVPVGGAA
jgi:hypothetical protein